jgi:hypothetical protein
MARVFAVDVLRYGKCASRRTWIAAITEAAVIKRILAHLGLESAVPVPMPATTTAARTGVLKGHAQLATGWRTGGGLCNGNTWRFQYWHRDGMNPSRFSKGISGLIN